MLIRGLTPTNLARLAFRRRRPIGPSTKVFLAICDHWEPRWQQPTRELELQRVKRWRDRLPSLVQGITDHAGRPPQHTFFYPEEEYDPAHVEGLVELRAAGLGDVEIHLHHDDDTSDNLRRTLRDFARRLHEEHGLLKLQDGTITYGFIHGNWCLDNSRPDGRYCGVNDEIDVLIQTGCYADFTLPAAPSPAQTKTINSIYYATDDPTRPKSHDHGTLAAVGRQAPDDSLLMIQGPLCVDWHDRIRGVVPRIDYNNYQGRSGPSLERFLRWVDVGVHVRGRPDWRFVKVHTHGCEEGNEEILLGEPMRRFHESLAEYAAENPSLEYYYVTAREMAGLVHQAEAGNAQPDIPAASR